jgi:hypothetical protein
VNQLDTFIYLRRLSFAGLMSTAKTVSAPKARASWMAEAPNPPAPNTATVSPVGKYKPAWHNLTPALITPANIRHPISDSIAHCYSINLFEQQHSFYNLRARSGDHQTAGNEHVRPVVGLPSRFASSLVAGDSGFGKRDALRLRSEHSSSLRDQRVGILTRPQAKMAEFCRELGHPFGVTLSPSDRWHSSKSLREKWLVHTEAAVYRPVLIIDQAQEMK